MARIRTIKPAYWGHPVIARLDAAARLAGVALLNFADDEGYFLADPALVRSFMFPFDEDSSNARRVLSELSRVGYIEVREHTEMGPIGRVVTFLDHQRVDRANSSQLKEYFDSSTIRRALDERSSLEKEGKGREKERKKDTHTTLGVAELVHLGVQEKHARDWLKARKAKRLPLTETALDDVKAEAEKAGLTLADAVKAAATRGWAGFRASWLTDGSAADPQAVAAEAERLMQERENANRGH